MPASFTHQCFGDEVWLSLSSDLQKLITKYQDYYNLGLQGPDIFFYYRPLNNTYVRKFGQDMHKENAYNFFKEHINEKEEKLVYILGFINHFILDYKIHGYLNKTVSSLKHHFREERDLDMYFLNLINPKDKFPSNRFTLTHNLSSVIGYDLHVEEKIIYETIKSFKKYNKIFYHDSSLVRNSLSTFMKVTQLPFSEMFIKDKPLKNDNIDTYIDLYEEALIIAKDAIENYVNGHLLDIFNNTFSPKEEV